MAADMPQERFCFLAFLDYFNKLLLFHLLQPIDLQLHLLLHFPSLIHSSLYFLFLLHEQIEFFGKRGLSFYLGKRGIEQLYFLLLLSVQDQAYSCILEFTNLSLCCCFSIFISLIIYPFLSNSNFRFFLIAQSQCMLLFLITSLSFSLFLFISFLICFISLSSFSRISLTLSCFFRTSSVCISCFLLLREWNSKRLSLFLAVIFESLQIDQRFLVSFPQILRSWFRERRVSSILAWISLRFWSQNWKFGNLEVGSSIEKNIKSYKIQT